MFGWDLNDNKESSVFANKETDPIYTGSSGLSENVPIVFRDELAQCIYSPEVTLPRLGTNDYVEISLVVEGGGIHRIFNEASECHAGDIYNQLRCAAWILC